MQWFERCYDRLLIDNHITEDDPSFMTRFNPATYVAMVKKARVNSAMVYACCHNGNCYYPTNVGRMHKALGGRDIFGEIVKLLKKEDIVPVAYYTVIYHNDSAKRHPAWRMEDFNGNQHNGRYWYSCPNSSEYRAFAKTQIREIVAYDVAGIFIDMTFWPVVCVCHNCRRRYLEETGKEIPSTIDWNNKGWVTFQRARERWMAEFAYELSSSAKMENPDVTVNHQFSPVLHGWSYGQSPAIAAACDYTGGDFYGGKYQQSLGTKVLAAFSKKMPFEFHTSRCVNLLDHTSMKSEEELFCSIALTLANGGAYCLIDAINPDGTLSEDVYIRLGRVAEKVKVFKDKVQSLIPTIVADVGLYFSMSSHMDVRDNGKNLKSVTSGISHMTPSTELVPLKEVLGTAIILSRAKIPYRIVTNDKVDLCGLKAVIINDSAFMSEREVKELRAFVYEGGTLIATGSTSLYNMSRETSGNFQLSDVFGVSYSGMKSQRISYLTFKGEVDTIPSGSAPSIERNQFALCNIHAPLVSATTATVLSGISGTYFDPDDSDQYASIHSNPPGFLTDYHGMTVNHFGKGRCIYLYSSLLAIQNHAQQRIGELLFKEYAPSGIILTSNAPASVEITVLKSTLNNAFLLCFVNYQRELPNVAVYDISVTIKLPGEIQAKVCSKVSDNQQIELELQNGVTTMVLPCLETIEMIEIATN